MKHMHSTTDKSYYNRGTWFHDHPGSFIMVDGEVTHDHKEVPASYVENSTRFLFPADEAGAD